MSHSYSLMSVVFIPISKIKTQRHTFLFAITYYIIVLSTLEPLLKRRGNKSPRRIQKLISDPG